MFFAPMLKLRLAGLIAAAAVGIGGCAEYLDRRDTVMSGTGEAVQTNIVTHQIDPWPAHARFVHATTDGDRLQRAMERYRNPRAGTDTVSSSTQTGSPGAAAAPARTP